MLHTLQRSRRYCTLVFLQLRRRLCTHPDTGLNYQHEDLRPEAFQHMTQVRQAQNHHGWDMDQPNHGVAPAAAYCAEPKMLPGGVAAPVGGLPCQHAQQRMHRHAFAPAGSLPGDMHLGGMAYGSAAMGARHAGADVQPLMPAEPLAWGYDEQQGSRAKGPYRPSQYTPAAQDFQERQALGQGQHSMYGSGSGQAGLDTMDQEHATWSHRAPGLLRSPDHPFNQDPTFHQGYQHQGLAPQQHQRYLGSAHAGRRPLQRHPVQGQLEAGLRGPAMLQPLHAGGMDVLECNPAYEGGQHSLHQVQPVK